MLPAAMALAAPAFVRRLPSSPAIVLVLSATVVVLVAATRSLATAKTRAVGLVLGLFGLAALVRLFGWQLAVAAGEHVNSRLYEVSRGIASLGVICEAAGQLAAVTWLGTRRRIVGQVLTSIAILVGFGLTWQAARSTADPVMSVRGALHEVEAGNLDAEVPVYDGSELGLLQAGFNRMAHGLREREERKPSS